MRQRNGLKFFAATLVLASAGAASAKPQAAATPPLKPVDAAVADLNALSVSLRDFSVDLRQPVGFTNVYRVPGQPGMLMRSSGAMYAVFPNSTYVSTPVGPLAKVPAGTVFYIGLPPDPSHEVDDQPIPRGGIDTRVLLWHDARMPNFADARIDESIPDAGHVVSDRSRLTATRDPSVRDTYNHAVDAALVVSPTVANHDGYRAQRVAELLRRATRAIISRREASGETPATKVDDTSH